MKSIRRSLNKDRISPPTAAPPISSAYPTQPFSSLSSQSTRTKSPPLYVIRALESYAPRRVTELKFTKGDFFHVEGERRDEAGDWWEASNPATGARGLVPRDKFQVLGKSAKDQPPFGSVGGNGGPKPSALSLGEIGHSAPPPPGGHPNGLKTAPLSNGGGPGSAGMKGNLPASAGAGGLTGSMFMQVPGPGTPGIGGKMTGGGSKSQPLYGVVQYDFVAERHDELDAKRGEPIIVIAQSNHEWFVAKPIGRLGGPGLIPVAFVEVQDVTTGKAMSPEKVEELIRSAVVPKVEDWKKATAAYKGNSIPLGRFDLPNTQGIAGSGPVRSPGTAPVMNPTPSSGGASTLHQRQQSTAGQQAASVYEDYGPSGQQRGSGVAPPPAGYGSAQVSQSSLALASTAQPSPPYDDPPSGDGEDDGYATVDELRERYGVIAHASVESFHFEQGHFWFHLRAHFARMLPSGREETTVLVLYRLYDDFYDFQIALMDAFPAEAGRAPPEGSGGPPPNRILPMMPGPSDHVDELVCAQRQQDLSVYLEDLCCLPLYIRECELVYEFLGPREGDVELEGDPQAMGVNGQGAHGTDAEGEVVEYLNRMGPGGSDTVGEAARGVDSMSVRDERGSYPPGDSSLGYASGSSAGSQGGYASQARMERERERASNLPPTAMGGGMPGNGSTQTGSSAGTSSSRRSPPYPGSVASDRPGSTVPSSTHSSGSHQAKKPSVSGVPMQPPLASGSSAAAAAQQGFHRIKIYQRRTDDLIAIRVPTNVTHAQLLDRIRERIGGEVNTMRWRDESGMGYSTGGSLPMPASAGGRLVALDNEDDLQRWLEGGNRMVLYAD